MPGLLKTLYEAGVWGPGRLRGALGETLQEAQPSGATCTQVTLSLEPRSEEERVLRVEGCERYEGGGCVGSSEGPASIL